MTYSRGDDEIYDELAGGTRGHGDAPVGLGNGRRSLPRNEEAARAGVSVAATDYRSARPVGTRRTLRTGWTLRTHRSLRPDWTLWTGRALRAGIARRTWAALRTLRARNTFRPWRARRSRIALGTCAPRVTLVAFLRDEIPERGRGIGLVARVVSLQTDVA